MINAFAYCSNDPVNMVDYWGTDAIWLQATMNVGTFGHTGLAVQYDGGWYYWYWGPKEISGYLDEFRVFFGPAINRKRNPIGLSLTSPASIFFRIEKFKNDFLLSAAKALLTDVKPECIFEIVPQITGRHNAVSEINNHYGYNIIEVFTEFIYFKGDFTETYHYFDNIQKEVKSGGGKQYNLFKNNCMQTTVDGLLKGKFLKNNLLIKSYLKKIKNKIIPNISNNSLKLLLYLI